MRSPFRSKRPVLVLGLAALALGALAIPVAAAPPRGSDRNPFNILYNALMDSVFGLSSIKEDTAAIRDAIGDPNNGLAEIKREVRIIEGEVTDPGHGLAEIKNEVQTIETDVGGIKTDVGVIKTQVTHAGHGLAEIKREVQIIESEVTDPRHGLLEIKQEIQAIEATVQDIDMTVESIEATVQDIDAKVSVPSTFKLSSGPFQLPSTGSALDWSVINNGSTSETFTMKTFEYLIGPTRTQIDNVTVTLGPGRATHNANSIGAGRLYQTGAIYEAVLQASSPNVMPMVVVWQNTNPTNAAIPGTLIPAGSWVRVP